jgi:DMSO/TMAO reductase YedYZ molybdopterin-dependent catalytic subunit
MDSKDFKMPKGQVPTGRLYPISIFGKPNEIDLENYKVKITGLVARPIEVTYEDIIKKLSYNVQFDIHCVDGWSYLGAVFTGIYPKELFKNVHILEDGKFVMIKSIDGYSTDLQLDFLMSENVVLVYKKDGKDLDIANGYPLRLVVDGKYAYKDAKWVVEFEVIDKDHPGYWEKRGYSRSADVCKEERRE